MVHPTGSRGVEKFGILVPLKGLADFGPSFLVQGMLLNRHVKSVHGKRTEEVFRGRDRTPLLKEI
jgi:hypothetical protein